MTAGLELSNLTVDGIGLCNRRSQVGLGLNQEMLYRSWGYFSDRLWWLGI